MIYSYIPQYHLEISSFFSMSSQISLVTYSRILPGIDEKFINPWYHFKKIFENHDFFLDLTYS